VQCGAKAKQKHVSESEKSEKSTFAAMKSDKTKNAWSAKAAEIMHDRKKANDIGDMIDAIAGKKNAGQDASVPLALLRAVVDIITHWAKQEQKRRRESEEEGDVFKQWNQWVRKRAEDAMEAAAKRVAEDGAWAEQEFALVAWFKLFVAFHKLRKEEEGKRDRYEKEGTKARKIKLGWVSVVPKNMIPLCARVHSIISTTFTCTSQTSFLARYI
jgi:hypothetical protein